LLGKGVFAQNVDNQEATTKTPKKKKLDVPGGKCAEEKFKFLKRETAFGVTVWTCKAPRLERANHRKIKKNMKITVGEGREGR